MGKQGKKDNKNTHHFANTERERRRDDAEVRQATHDGLTKQEKLDLIRSRRGNSAKELKRVLAST